MQDQTIASHLTPRSAVDFSDPKLLAQIWEFGAGHLCSYLIALAAVQRGLDVTFYGSSLDSRSAGRSRAFTSAVPRLFSISDGKRSCFFDQSSGFDTGNDAWEVARDKGKSKAAFIRSGVPTPNGIMANTSVPKQLAEFLRYSTARKFVAKPSDGSLGRGVVVDLDRNGVIELVQRGGKNLTLVEEQIEGREYRVYVAGGRVAAAYEKPGCFVVGNGKLTIAQLIAERNRKRQQNPYLAKSLIDPVFAANFLARSRIPINAVPILGAAIKLHHAKNIAIGGIPRECTETLSPACANAAVAACAAVGLANAGVDVIVDARGPHVLELNSRAHIGGHSFPFDGTGCGNATAEAIVDIHFPTPHAVRDLTRIIDAKALNAAFAEHGAKTVHPVRLL